MTESRPTRDADATASPLEPYRWRQRILLTFARTHADPAISEIDASFRSHAIEARDRDLLTGSVGAISGHIGRDDLTPRQVADLREQFGVGMDQFAVILIGKDGIEKLRLGSVPQPREIFALIDSMPMRQQEMRRDEP